MRFKEENCFQNLEVQSEATSADVEAVASYSEDRAKIIDDGGYTKQQICHVDKQLSIRRQCPLGLSLLENLMSGFQASKDRLTLMLEANTADDFELKPVLIYHSENPRALKNDAKSTLLVVYRWNNKM